MGEKYSKEDHDKCKKVAEVFQELHDMLGDTCVLDAGEFGFVYLTYYREQKSCFDRNKVYRNAEELFEALWDEWLYSEVCSLYMGQRMRKQDLKRSTESFRMKESRNML